MTVFDPGTISYFGIHSSDGNGRKPILLPELPVKERSVDKIYQRLDRGEPILGWYCIELPDGPLDNLFVYRKEHDLLCRYFISISKHDNEPVLRLEKIWLFNKEKISDLWDWELCKFGHLYYDNEGFIADQRCYVHDISYEEARSYLETEPVFLVDEDRFLRQKE